MPAPVCAPVAEVVAESQAPVVAENVVATEEVKVEDPALAAVSAEEDIVTEPAGFAYGSALSLGHMALDWGVATIGSGTLMPTSGIMGFGGGYFPRGWNNGNGGDSGSPGSSGPPVIVNQITIVNNVGCPQPPTAIPEPAAVLTWLVLLGLSPLVIKRLRSPSPAAASENASSPG